MLGKLLIRYLRPYGWLLLGVLVFQLIAALALLVFAILPKLGLLDPGRASFAPLIGLVGVVYVIGGLLDHAELVRILGNDGHSHVSPV